MSPSTLEGFKCMCSHQYGTYLFVFVHVNHSTYDSHTSFAVWMAMQALQYEWVTRKWTRNKTLRHVTYSRLVDLQGFTLLHGLRGRPPPRALHFTKFQFLFTLMYIYRTPSHVFFKFTVNLLAPRNQRVNLKS